jgi:NarL family two-component system sensor histidine kinase LiaS
MLPAGAGRGGESRVGIFEREKTVTIGICTAEGGVRKDVMFNKKLTSMIWRGTAESILHSLLLLATVLYILHQLGYRFHYDSWFDAFETGLALFGAAVGLGVLYGMYTNIRLKTRLDQLQESMLLLEKGSLGRPIAKLGEDEIGRLAQQLGRIEKKWQEQVSSLQRLSTDNAKLAEQARLSAIVEERQRLARELHDAVSQQLFAISMTATAVGRTMDKDFERARRQVSLIEEMASVAQSEMRALLLHLRPVHLEGKRLEQGLHDLIAELRAKVPMDIRLEMDEGIALSRGIEDHLFRIVQEALSNTLRHSRASAAEVKLLQKPDSVRLLIRDDGIGFDPEEKKHTSYGLVSIRERVNEIGGSMHIISAPGKGTRIEIRVPIMREEREMADVGSRAD